MIATWLGVVRAEAGEARATTDEPPVYGQRRVADTPADKRALHFIKPGEAHATTDERPICGREFVASKSTNGDWQHVNGRPISLHYEPPRTEVNK